MTRASSVDAAIIDVLSNGHSHLTSAEIHEQVRTRLPAVNPSTIYRALERLAGQCKVSISDIGIGAAVYELVHEGNHHHLVCQECRTVFTIDDAEADLFFQQVAKKYRFELITRHLVLFGVCENCKKRQLSMA